jgi:hypothetical protein
MGMGMIPHREFPDVFWQILAGTHQALPTNHRPMQPTSGDVMWKEYGSTLPGTDIGPWEEGR